MLPFTNFKLIGLLLFALVGNVLIPGSDSLELPNRPRRDFLYKLVGAHVGAPVVMLAPSVAGAVAPISLGETQNVGALALRKFRPKPPRLLRQKLNQQFAVLLMRTSYRVTDELDVVAMNQFQRDFFLIRSAEYETYVRELGPGLVSQGDLSDPYYFDFISFTQYLAINRVLSNDPPMVFQEEQAIDKGPDEPNEFVTVVVRRDPAISNDKLVAEHNRRVGRGILDALDATFGHTPSAIPTPAPGSLYDAEEVLRSLDQLKNLFLLNGYAFDGDATISKPPKLPGSASGATFSLTLKSPASLWGGLSLAFQLSPLRNDFLNKCACVLVEDLGYQVASSSVKYEGNNEVTILTLR